MIQVKLKEKITPRWYEFRKWIAKFLVWLARKIEPNSVDAWLYDVEKRLSKHIPDLHDQYMDMVLYGKSFKNPILDDLPYVETDADNVHTKRTSLPPIYWSKPEEQGESEG